MPQDYKLGLRMLRWRLAFDRPRRRISISVIIRPGFFGRVL